VSRGEFGAVLEYSNFRLRLSLLLLLRPPVARYGEAAIVKVVLEYSNFRIRLSLLLLLRPPVARYGEAAIVKAARHVFGVDFILRA